MKEANFGNIIIEILTKKGERREKWWDGSERKKNFDDVVVEIGEKKKEIQKNKNDHLPLAHMNFPTR